jgi:potassium-transporting ATPase ATP-binding subunit
MNPSNPINPPRGRRSDRKHTPKVNMAGLYQRAVRDAFSKLNPRIAVRNPVMFIVWVGTIITALVTIDPNMFGAVAGDLGQERLLNGLITIILFFTVLFANFAEAVAEGRGKAQADSLRARRLNSRSLFDSFASRQSSQRDCGGDGSCGRGSGIGDGFGG